MAWTSRVNRRFAVACLAATILAPTALWAQEGSIKIGASYPLSGSQELVGKQALLGAQIAVDYLNEKGGIKGRQVELVVRDDAADPNRGVANVNELAGLGANLIVGGIQTSVVLAVKPILAEANVVFISTAAFADALTTQDFTSNYFRVTATASAISRAQAKLMLERHPNVTKWTGVVPDAAFGRSGWEAFATQIKEAFTAAGKEVEFVDPALYKFGGTDFRNQIAALASSGAQGVYLFGAGSDTITLLSQAASTGVLGNFEVLLDAGGDTILANALGSRVPDGLWTQSHWDPDAYKSSELAQYVVGKASEKLGGANQISGFLGGGFNAVYAYSLAVEKAGSTDTVAVIKALEGLTFDNVIGSITLRPEDHQAVIDINFLQIGPGNGPLGWVRKASFVAPGPEVAIPVKK